ncbi:MAG: hypothetical protein K2L27_05255 [Muribaculaceae bacterium]|nr:hypothetical protein [Muribaculaceae bacterium]
MKRFNYRKYLTRLLIAIAAVGISDTLAACGSMRSYWGIENEYEWGDGHHHHHHRPPKPPKHKKHKKHKHHHHHDD